MNRIPSCNTCECGSHSWTTLTKWGVTLVDTEDAYLLMEYAFHLVCAKRRSSYAVSWRLGKERMDDGLLHRAIVGETHLSVDHINGNGLDNRKVNIRLCTQSDNTKNRRKNRMASSRFKGVFLYKPNGKWMSAISVDRNKVHLGYFINEVDAAKAYDAAAISHFGEFAKTNF